MLTAESYVLFVVCFFSHTLLHLHMLGNKYSKFEIFINLPYAEKYSLIVYKMILIEKINFFFFSLC